MGYGIGQPVPWPVPPDWSAAVRERLQWNTEILRARAGKQQKRELRLAPARQFSFRVVADGQARRVADALLAAQGAQQWALPIWHDVQAVGPLAAGDSVIACRTDGFDFEVARYALLWRSLDQWEVVQVHAVGSGLEIEGALAGNWPKGTRLYPLRDARLVGSSEESAWHDEAGERRITFEVSEPCDWTPATIGPDYRGYPVLEHRSDEGDDPQASHERDIDTVEVGTGPVHYYDFPAMPFRRTSHRWLCGSREEHTALRGLLYALRGRAGALWVPTGNADLLQVAPLASDSTSLVVEWAGYTAFGLGQLDRQDVRIELAGGAVYYRRITGAIDLGATESLTLDAALGVAVTPAQVKRISFLVLSEGTSDTVELEHVTDADGITRCALAFQAVKHEL